MAKEKAQQVWKFTKSQQLLLQEQARQHQIERQPLTAYQERSRNDLYFAFKEELGIPEDFPVTIDLANMQLVSAVEDVPANEDEPETPEDEPEG